MISHLFREKTNFLVLILMICSIPAIAFAGADKTSNGMYMFSIRVDVWKENMPFYFYRSGLNEMISGNCE